jgi:hypothetical protein
MTKLKPSFKVKMDNEQKRTMLTIGIAIAVTIFCLTATKVLLTNGSYKRHVISARHQAIGQLKANLANSKALIDQYRIFESKDNPSNIIGGKNTSDQAALPPNGNNSRIVLDALPSSYDFPALVTSASKILTDSGMSSPTLGGSDQSDTVSTTTAATTQPVTIPLTISGTGTYSSVQALIKDLERSIRPFDINRLQLQGTAASFSMAATMNTYYQPPKSLTITYQEVK